MVGQYEIAAAVVILAAVGSLVAFAAYAVWKGLE